MKSINSFTAVALATSLLCIPSVYAANNDHSSYKKIDAELKTAWSELDKLKSSKHLDKAKSSIKQALIESYAVQGKELRAKWLQYASLEEVSKSVKLQNLHHQKDFPYYPQLAGVRVEKLNSKYIFRTAFHGRSYHISQNTIPDVYSTCVKLLPNIKVDGELHSVPEDFPLEKVLKSEYRKKYLLPAKTYK